MSLDIRQVSGEDDPMFYHALVLHRKEWYSSLPVPDADRYLKRLLESYVDGKSIFSVARRYGRVAGCCTGKGMADIDEGSRESNKEIFQAAREFLEGRIDEAFYLSTIIVDQSFRGNGVAGKLLDESIRFARKEGFSHYTTDAHSGKIQFALTRKLGSPMFKHRKEESNLLVYRF